MNDLRPGWLTVEGAPGAYLYASFCPDWLEFIVLYNRDRGVWRGFARSLNPGRPSLLVGSWPTCDEAMIALEEWRTLRNWENGLPVDLPKMGL